MSELKVVAEVVDDFGGWTKIRQHTAMCCGTALATLARADLAATVAEQAKEIERLKGMVDEIQAARYVQKEHNNLLIRLAASQAYAAQLRDALGDCAAVTDYEAYPTIHSNAHEALAIKPDETALREHDAKLVERIADEFRHSVREHILQLADKIRKGEFRLSAHQDSPTKPASS